MLHRLPCRSPLCNPQQQHPPGQDPLQSPSIPTGAKHLLCGAGFSFTPSCRCVNGEGGAEQRWVTRYLVPSGHSPRCCVSQQRAAAALQRLLTASSHPPTPHSPSPYSPPAPPPRPVPPAADGEGNGEHQDHSSAQQRSGHGGSGAGGRGLRGGCGQSGAGERLPGWGRAGDPRPRPPPRPRSLPHAHNLEFCFGVLG